MGAACCSGDARGEQITNSELRGSGDHPDSGTVGLPSLPATAAGGPAPPGLSSAQCLEVTFRCPDGRSFRKTFTRRPLGVDFGKASPLVMKRIQKGSHADELGVQSGWEIVAIDGEDVASKDFAYTYSLLRSTSSLLPETC